MNRKFSVTRSGKGKFRSKAALLYLSRRRRQVERAFRRAGVVVACFIHPMMLLRLVECIAVSLSCWVKVYDENIFASSERWALTTNNSRKQYNMKRSNDNNDELLSKQAGHADVEGRSP